VTTQQDCSIGIGLESTWGTPVTVSQFLEFTDEDFDAQVATVQGKGMRVGARVTRSARRVISKVDPGGKLTIEAPIKGLGSLLNAALGSFTNTAVPAQAGAFQQVHTPTSTDPLPSYTIQKGVPPVGGGATLAHTFAGMVCNSLEISGKDGDYVTVATEWLGKDFSTATAYAAPSYPAGLDVPFHFVHAALVLGGTVVVPTTTAPATGGTVVANIREFGVKWDNGLDKNGFNAGGAGRRTRKPVTGAAALTGKLTAELTDAVMRDAYLLQQQLALLITLTHTAAIGSSINPVLQILVPAIKLNGKMPSANGGDVVTISSDFDGLDPLAGGSPLYVVYRTSDTAP